MALIDTTELLADPDFIDTVSLIRRSMSVNDKGLNVLSEAEPVTVNMSVHNGAGNFLKRLSDSARLEQSINVYFQGELRVESSSGYCDVIVFNSVRYVVILVDSFSNWGAGFCHALCLIEKAHA